MTASLSLPGRAARRTGVSLTLVTLAFLLTSSGATGVHAADCQVCVHPAPPVFRGDEVWTQRISLLGGTEGHIARGRRRLNHRVR